MLRVSVAAATLATAAAPMFLLGAGSSFQADEFCEIVDTSGVVDLPPTGHCFDYQRKTFCEIETVSAPSITVGFEVCVPFPIGSATGDAEVVTDEA
jgi:hypothetical protein